MIYEVAEITVKPGEEAVSKMAWREPPTFPPRERMPWPDLQRVVEDPSVHRLVVQWENGQYHTVDFRDSDGFQEWRRLVGSFANSPVVTHTAVTASYQVS